MAENKGSRMTEEQIKQKFKEAYPDFMRGDEQLSPYFDIWEYAIEITTEEMQEEINDLEWQLQEVAKDNDNYQKENKELQEEINELKNIKDVADLLRLNNDTVITMCQLNNRFVSAKNKLEQAKGIIRKLLEDIEIAENEYKFTSQTAIKAEQFLKE